MLRDMASQIADSFRAYGSALPLSTAVVFGGVSIGPQRRQLARGVDILVATPGRLLDLIDSGSLGLSGVEILVLDEATSQIDVDSERLIHDALADFGRDRTLIMITHRESTLALATKIVRIEHGLLEPVTPAVAHAA